LPSGRICRLAVAAKVFWKWHGRPARGMGEFLGHGQDAHATLEDRQPGDAPLLRPASPFVRGVSMPARHSGCMGDLTNGPCRLFGGWARCRW